MLHFIQTSIGLCTNFFKSTRSAVFSGPSRYHPESPSLIYTKYLPPYSISLFHADAVSNNSIPSDHIQSVVIVLDAVYSTASRNSCTTTLNAFIYIRK